ncbi:DUF1648 domain-containing protein [Ornithinimicrobium faecis]|uniref:DUF1648 domain-containing protein n=1 Tax=Ornithinimicrobium faecis TaxID=2934158 RepID=A0ABY4YXU5_9MICO|nr:MULTISPECIES: DUF1648 domain-containing protein [unclassified Ornithinimicrobium]USQ81608.1 DUF1648 domain-containing protein [Ornithinimicrobium sp. HY1793]
MTIPSTTERRVRRAHLATTVLVTAICGVALLVTMLVVAGDLPDRLATHFDQSGTANDDLSRGMALTMFGLVGVGLPALLIAVFAATEWWRGEGARAFSGFLAGLPVGLSTLFAGLVLANRGAGAPDQVRLSPWVILPALGLAVVVGVVVALLVPRGLPRPAPETVTPVVLAPTERASWFGRVEMGRLPMVAMVAGVLVMVFATLVSGLWWLWLVTALVVLPIVAVTSFVVTVDRSGVTWRSALGLPRGHLPLERITDAGVVDVSPAEFGGLGLRMKPGALGLVTRSGSALQVTHGKKRFVATVDDPATGAGLLLGYLQAGDRTTR